MDLSLKRILRLYLAVMLFAFVSYQLIPMKSIPDGVDFHTPSLMDVMNSFITGARAGDVIQFNGLTGGSDGGAYIVGYSSTNPYNYLGETFSATATTRSFKSFTVVGARIGAPKNFKAVFYMGEPGTSALTINKTIFFNTSVFNLESDTIVTFDFDAFNVTPSGKYALVFMTDSGFSASNYIHMRAIYDNMYVGRVTLTNSTVCTDPDNYLCYRIGVLADDLKLKLVGSTENATAAPPVIQEIREYPTTGANIYTDFPSYVVGDTINTEWFIADTPYTNFASSCEFLIDDVVISQSVRQRDNYSIPNAQIGTKKLDIACGVLWNTIAGTKIVQVVGESQSYLAYNTTQFSRVPFNVTYHIGYSLTGYSSTWIDIGIFSATGQKIDNLIGISTNDGALQAQGTRVYPVGTYTVKLYDAKRNRVIATSPLTIVQTDKIPTIGISVSNITTDREFYYINDYMNINYRVDDANYTNFSIAVQIYNNDIAQITKQYTIPTTEQVSAFDTLINTKDGLLCEGARYCWFESGINTVRLIAYNSTFSRILSTRNITVSTTTVDGWGLVLSSNNITTTEKLTIRTIIPTGFQGTMLIRDAGFGNATSTIYSQSVSAGTNTYITAVNRVNREGVGYYDVELKDGFGAVKIHIPLTVRKISGTAPGQPGTNPMSATTNAFLSTTMVPFILLLIFASIGFFIGAFMGAVIGFGAGFIFLSVFGMIPLWALFLFAILVITAFAIMSSKQLTGGN